MKLSAGIGILGCGTVGGSVADRLQRERAAIEARSGVRYELRAIAVRDEAKVRATSLGRELFTTDAGSVIDDPQIDVVIECIGGTADATELVERALDRGRHVVTANKDLLATQGPRLAAIAASRGVTLRYEAAVGGAIPIVRSLDDALAGDEVRAIAGVFNGTCTSVLSAMEDGANYADALLRAQRLGYAEADPSNDVEGHDAAHKLALLVQLAFNLAVLSPRIRRSGITAITRRDIARARMLGLRIRLIAAAVRTPDGVQADVAPLLVPGDHSFAKTRGAENVARVIARDAGALELRGAGAGGPATASAVLGDVVTTLRAIGERHDLSHRGRDRALQPALEVAPLFDALPRHPDLAHLAIWEDDAGTIDLSKRRVHAARGHRVDKRSQGACPQV
ncbi:MAG: homoserine dehydrogenase [Candidatus Eremiobacteraeota bacterium]|nr:homoserine dehydrogenase [Candidatus Eremiobacteraeota bacterium]